LNCFEPLKAHFALEGSSLHPPLTFTWCEVGGGHASKRGDPSAWGHLMNNGQRTTDNGQRTTDNGQRTTYNVQRTTDNGQRTTYNDKMGAKYTKNL
jgi:hypothetical protein